MPPRVEGACPKGGPSAERHASFLGPTWGPDWRASNSCLPDSSFRSRELGGHRSLQTCFQGVLGTWDAQRPPRVPMSRVHWPGPSQASEMPSGRASSRKPTWDEGSAGVRGLLPSFSIPTLRHFMKRQAWQDLRLRFVISHSLVAGQLYSMFPVTRTDGVARCCAGPPPSGQRLDGGQLARCPRPPTPRFP